MVDQVRAHADHVHIEFPEEFEVMHEVFDCLPRQADHDAGADLVAGFAQPPQGVDPVGVAVNGVGGMEFRVQLRVGAFDPQQIAVRSGVEPAAVSLRRLFAERKRDAEPSAVDLLDAADGRFDEIDPLRIAPLAALEDDRTVTELRRQPGGGKNLLQGHGETPDFSVAATDAAIETVFAADV
ncbi:hypothetical protein SDC9_138210 [bioreactor metagenome]|uniref:Uncharacterized protein n=1 Tax=bioreactor metagenome TaxID=1076179 RepID=A0A645DNP0_9ZZZZ